MTKTLIFISFVAFGSASCNDNDNGTTNVNIDLLTGETSKSWNITGRTPAFEDPNCGPEAQHVKDNTWTFSLDGDFSFDNGTITEGETCGDIVDFTGTWTFNEDDRTLIISEGGMGDFMIQGKILSLTADKLVISDGDIRITFSSK